ncbi:MAG: YkgJ family cysteine cluster protein [Promethearchaeota archaeon]|jgi:Fe-S-cluster containining protein
MSNKCEDCGKCCLETEMILSRSDIEIITKHSTSDLKKEDFSVDNKYGQSELKNIEGHCVFLEESSKMCTIYEHRPTGCRFYPLIYDFQERTCILDGDCPRTNLFYRDKKKFIKSCVNLQNYLKNQLNLKIT